ncbi:PHD finger protein 12 isoform X2 [Helicoverpa armigera]|uniref:PHD finger protein 12 isoform X2 n=1 Tax=Helicoverpa armigera TaxID=29058 RepID=UPI003082B567
MSNVGYDLDTSGGLMPLIRALIKPPDEDLNVQKPKKPQHPYYKRPGKGHNHDSCDACGEGGDLICCDRCPASFHLGCYDPPLDENDIPAGLWLCKECRASDENKPASSRSSRAQSPADNKSDTEKKASLRNRTNSAKKKSKDEEEEVKKEPEKELTPMEILVKAAKIMNPTQFELPREMRIPCIFPGTDKDPGKNGNGSLVSVDAWGCVPLPAKSCFVCQATCKHAPLLQCDYCPLLFHQDCLDPPLTALPTGRWMCPNHVEQYIDWKLVNSISATERVALWEKFSGPVDQQAVKVDFIRRAKKPRPAFRIKVPVCMRGRVSVPAMVRHHYRHPPPLLPSRREYVRCRNVLKNLKETDCYDPTEEDEDAPKHKICMNLSCRVYGAESAPLRGVTEEDAADDLHAISSEHTAQVDQHQLCRNLSCQVYGAEPAPLRGVTEEDAADDLHAISSEHTAQVDHQLCRNLSCRVYGAEPAPLRGVTEEDAADDLHAISSEHTAQVDQHQICRNLSCRVYGAEPAPLRGVTEEDAADDLHAISSEHTAQVDQHQICRNLSCRVYGAEPAPLRGVTEEDAADDLHAISSEHTAQPERHTDSSSDLSDSDFEYLTASVKKRKVSSEDKSPPKRGKSERLELRPDANVEELLAVVDDQLKKLDERLVKLLAWQRLQQVIAGEQAAGSFRGCGISGAAKAALRRSLDRAKLARLGLLRRALPSELLSRADRARIAAAVWGGPRDPRPESPTPPTSPGHSLSDAIVRATLCAITKPDKNGVGSGLGRPIPMRLSSLSVGTDSGCDVRLDARACRNVSRHHAVIFMDEVSRHFELINYSEWGTCVNGVLYACDVTAPDAARDVTAADGTRDVSGPDAARDVTAPADLLRDVVRHRMREPLKINGNLTIPLPDEQPCRCPSSPPLSAGAWEGSALVPHGALLQFGCLPFVFSITDQGFGYESDAL